MSATDPIGPAQASAPSSADPATAEASAASNNGDVNSATTISSLSNLKEQAPKVYHQLMMSIATSMISAMHKRDTRLKELWRKARDDVT